MKRPAPVFLRARGASAWHHLPVCLLAQIAAVATQLAHVAARLAPVANGIAPVATQIARVPPQLVAAGDNGGRISSGVRLRDRAPVVTELVPVADDLALVLTNFAVVSLHLTAVVPHLVARVRCLGGQGAGGAKNDGRTEQEGLERGHWKRLQSMGKGSRASDLDAGPSRRSWKETHPLGRR
jgi:hypothetical protein